MLGPQDIADALEPPVDEIAEFIMRALEDLPPEVSTDVCERGIHLSGGGALLHNLDVELERRVGVTFVVPERPTHCVIMGTASILRDYGLRENLLIKP